MKELIALAALCAALTSPAGAATPLDLQVEQAYNVRYSAISDFGDGSYGVNVIWFDDAAVVKSAEALCKLPGVAAVRWATLREYLKSQRDVRLAAGRGNVYSCDLESRVRVYLRSSDLVGIDNRTATVVWYDTTEAGRFSQDLCREFGELKNVVSLDLGNNKFSDYLQYARATDGRRPEALIISKESVNCD